MYCCVKNILILSIVTIGILINGCVVSKPDCKTASIPDYNTRVDVSGAHFDRVLTPVGYSAIVASTISGAYLGYNSQMIHYYSKGEPKNLNMGSALIGAAIGFTSSYLLNRALGWGKVRPVIDPQKWVYRANKNYAMVSAFNSSDIRIIQKSIEPKYIVKNSSDAKEFVNSFPRSLYFDNAMKSGVENCVRNEMPDLIGFFPNSKYINDAKTRYIKESPSYEDLNFAVNKYYEIKLDLENLYLKHILKVEHALDFNSKYPTTVYKKQAVMYSFNTSKQARDKILSLKTSYKNDFILNETDLKQQKDIIKQNYLEGLFSLKQPSTLFELDVFYTYYNWLNYQNRPEDILQKYWTVGNKTFEEGDLVLASIRNISTDPKYGSWGITNYKANNFINDKLRNEVLTKVDIKSTSTLGQNNPEWDLWCNNTQYTAGIVKVEGEIKYLIYGEVENTSKFDLPVFVNASADLYSQMVGKGFIAEGANALSKALTGKSINENFNIKDKKLASASESFYIPVIPSKGKGSYAVLINFGEGKGNSGQSMLWDNWKVVQESYLNNLNTSVGFNNSSIGYSVIKKQEEWQKLAQEGLPNVILLDLWRNEEVKNEEWNNKYQAILAERRRIRAESREREEQQEKNKTGPCYELSDIKKGSWQVIGKDLDDYYELKCLSKKYTAEIFIGDGYYYANRTFAILSDTYDSLGEAITDILKRMECNCN